MSISKLATRNKLRPFILAKVSLEVLDNLLDSDFDDIFNDVAKDLNQGAEIRIEKFYKQTVAANAEDDDLTNYKTQRKILKVFSFKYEDDAYDTQIWTYIYEDDEGDGRLILKTAPSGAVQMTVLYLGDVEKVDDSTDEIDLPDNVLPEFIELCKFKILSDYSQGNIVDYEKMIQVYSDKARMKQDKRVLTEEGIKPYWLGLTGDKAYKYQILKNHVFSGDNVTADASGNFTWYT